MNATNPTTTFYKRRDNRGRFINGWRLETVTPGPGPMVGAIYSNERAEDGARWFPSLEALQRVHGYTPETFDINYEPTSGDNLPSFSVVLMDEKHALDGVVATAHHRDLAGALAETPGVLEALPGGLRLHIRDDKTGALVPVVFFGPHQKKKDMVFAVSPALCAIRQDELPVRIVVTHGMAVAVFAGPPTREEAFPSLDAVLVKYSLPVNMLTATLASGAPSYAVVDQAGNVVASCFHARAAAAEYAARSPGAKSAKFEVQVESPGGVPTPNPNDSSSEPEEATDRMFEACRGNVAAAAAVIAKQNGKPEEHVFLLLDRSEAMADRLAGELALGPASKPVVLIPIPEMAFGRLATNPEYDAAFSGLPSRESAPGCLWVVAIAGGLVGVFHLHIAGTSAATVNDECETMELDIHSAAIRSGFVEGDQVGGGFVFGPASASPAAQKFAKELAMLIVNRRREHWTDSDVADLAAVLCDKDDPCGAAVRAKLIRAGVMPSTGVAGIVPKKALVGLLDDVPPEFEKPLPHGRMHMFIAADGSVTCWQMAFHSLPEPS